MLKRIIKLIARLPIPVHYFVADYILYPLLYHVVRYRRSVVMENLKNSFPEKTEQEIRSICKKSYHHICNVIVEAVYGYGLSDDEMRRHISFGDTTIGENVILQKGGGIVMLAHYGNWEWLLNIGKQWQNPQLRIGGVYKQIKNKPLDNAVLDMRQHMGGLMIEKKRILREIVRLRHSENPVLFGLLSDQTPQPRNTHLWTTFLNQDTPWLTGSDTLAHKYDLPVLYVSVHSPKRGYYEVEYKVVSENPTQEDEFAITKKYIALLEQNIREQPELWLWTHKRWKYKR